jgi:hypothetical protein
MSTASYHIYILCEMSLSQSLTRNLKPVSVIHECNGPNQNSISEIHEWAMVLPQFRLGLGFRVCCWVFAESPNISCWGRRATTKTLL